jgi:hypothetical protein
MIDVWALDRRHLTYFRIHLLASLLQSRKIHLHRRLRPSSRHILPADLPNAIKHLGDQELDRLLAAVIAEQKHRGKKLPASDVSSSKKKVEAIDVPLTQGKLNAVRAAFKAGVTPSRIARQFGISQSDVRRALAREASKR